MKCRRKFLAFILDSDMKISQINKLITRKRNHVIKTMRGIFELKLGHDHAFMMRIKENKFKQIMRYEINHVERKL